MAFLNRVGNVLKQAVSKHAASSKFMAPNASLFQAMRCMSTSSKLFVGGLSYSTDELSLKEAFSQYGEVVEARVIKDRDTGRSRGFGFVTFTSSEAASSAIQGLDNQDLHGRQLRVNFATEKPRTGGFGAAGGYGSSGGGGYGGGYGGSGGYGGGYGGSGGGGYGGGGYQGGGGGGYQGGGGGYSSGIQNPPTQSVGYGNSPSGGGGGGGASPLDGFGAVQGGGGGAPASPLDGLNPLKAGLGSDFPSGPYIDTTSGLGDNLSRPTPLADDESESDHDILDKIEDEFDNDEDYHSMPRK